MTRSSQQPFNGWSLLAIGLLLGGTLLVGAPAQAEQVGPDPAPRRLTAREQIAARQSLAAEIDQAIEESGFSDARVGIHVRSLSDDTTLYSRSSDTLLNPASNMKVVTSSTALELLGPEFRFETSVYASRAIDAKGVLHGNLYVKGEGDPTFVSERMFRMVEDLWQLGLRRVTGDIILDDTYFDDRREGPGWEQEHSDRAYIAPTGAISFNYNAVAIHVRAGPKVGAPAIVTVDPASDYFRIDNRVVTTGPHSRRRHIPASIGAGAHQRIVVRGRQPINRAPAVYYRRIDNPPIYFGQTLKTYSRRRGIAFARGRVRRGAVPPSALALLQSHSNDLARIVTTMNKVSQNHIAEQLLKTVGAQVMGPPGSWKKGVQAVEKFLASEVGITPGSYVMKNGSGLNDTNRFSTRQITSVLAHVANHFQVAPEFMASLAIAGRDGTTRYRLDDPSTAGLIRAKTGTLENVSALSGYARTGTGETVAFSVLVNDHPGSYSTIIEGVDRIATAIATYGLRKHPVRSSPVFVATGADAKAQQERLQTYSSLGRARDPRNVRFLRAALRTEKDPLLRAVVAEAIFLSDPEAGRRILIDSFRPSEELLGKLRSLTYQQGAGGTPVLSSIADIAAEGDADALDRLVQAAYLGRQDVGLSSEIALTLTEVGHAAAGELIDALLRLPPAQGASVARLLAEGIRASGAMRHPIHRELAARIEAEQDPERKARLAGMSSELDLARQLGGQTRDAAKRDPTARGLPSLPAPSAAGTGAGLPTGTQGTSGVGSTPAGG